MLHFILFNTLASLIIKQKRTFHLRSIFLTSSFTDASAAQDTGEQGNGWNRTQNQNSANVGGGGRIAGSANINAADMQNVGKIKFDPPKVPVIFVLGGPGSGKVTHCDTLMQDRRGLIHINMMDLLQQYAMGNGKTPH